MLRAALYARYSSDLQKDRSIEDQLALCRSHAAREGLQIVATYEDRALSGGSILGRDGVASLLKDAAENRFDVVIVEALDRLSRDMADLATIYKRLMLLFAVAHAATALAPSFTAILAARFVAGICIGGIWAIAGGLAPRLVPARDVALATSVIFGGVAAALVLGVPLGTLIGELLGWRRLEEERIWAAIRLPLWKTSTVRAVRRAQTFSRKRLCGTE